MKRRIVVKLVLGAGMLVLLPWLFMQTLQNTIAEPFELDGERFSNWTLVAPERGASTFVAVGLRPPAMLTSMLFNELFDRTMSSMTAPGEDLLPLVFAREFGVGGLSIAELLQVARDVGLEQAPLRPVCMAVKREPFAGRTREFHFVLIDMPELAAFRRKIAAIAVERGGGARFEPLEPVLPIAGSDTAWESWWPLDVDPVIDCQAPITLLD